MPENVALKLDKINLSFGGKQIFKDFSLNLKFSESCCLIAPSGFGKSSLLNIIMGFVKADSGYTEICGIPLKKENISLIRKKIAWLPQNFNFNPSLTVSEILDLPFQFQTNKKQKPVREVLLEHLDLLKLNKEILNNSYGQISGGEKQRIGIIICKLLNRPLLLLDEPSSALDKDSKSLVKEYIFKDNKSAVLSCSHDEDWIEANSFCIDLTKNY